MERLGLQIWQRNSCAHLVGHIKQKHLWNTIHSTRPFQPILSTHAVPSQRGTRNTLWNVKVVLGFLELDPLAGAEDVLPRQHVVQPRGCEEKRPIKHYFQNSRRRCVSKFDFHCFLTHPTRIPNNQKEIPGSKWTINLNGTDGGLDESSSTLCCTTSSLTTRVWPNSNFVSTQPIVWTKNWTSFKINYPQLKFG